MSSATRKALSVFGVTASIVAGISLGGGTALAAPPECKAALQSGWGCLAIQNTKKHTKMRSLRIGGERGTCFQNLADKKTYAMYYAIPGAGVAPRPNGWLFYTGSKCDGGTLALGVTLDKWSGVDKDKYVTVTLVHN